MQPESDHDEPDLKAFEQHTLEGDQPACHPVAARDQCAGVGKLLGLVVQCLEACPARDRFGQPPHAEEQQEDADHKLEPSDVQPEPEHSAGRCCHGS